MRIEVLLELPVRRIVAQRPNPAPAGPATWQHSDGDEATTTLWRHPDHSVTIRQQTSPTGPTHISVSKNPPQV